MASGRSRDSREHFERCDKLRLPVCAGPGCSVSMTTLLMCLFLVVLQICISCMT